MTTASGPDQQYSASSYYAGSIRTLRGLLVSATPSNWAGLSSSAAGSSRDGADALPNATLRPQRIAPRSRLSAKGVFAETLNGDASSSNVGEKVESDSGDRALVDKILFQAGTARDPYDEDDRTEYPLFVVCPCYLPAEEQQEQTIHRVVATLDDRAFQPYLLVLFAAPSPSIPVKQLIAYYRALSAEARRNVKRMWIVHASLVTRFAVRFFLNTIVSGKVARKGKVKLSSSLGELARNLDLSLMRIPADVLLYNASIEPELPSNGSTRRLPVFGSSLQSAFVDGQPPIIVQDCLKHLQLPASLATEGIFRRVPKMSHMNLLRRVYDLGIPVDLSEWPDNSVLAASLLKLYLRSLPTPLLSTSLYPHIRRCPIGQDAAVTYLQREFLPLLSSERAEGQQVLALFAQIMQTLSAISKQSAQNKMTPSNLAIVMAPCLVRSSNLQEDVELCKSSNTPASPTSCTWARPAVQAGQSTLTSVLAVMIECYEAIFVHVEPPKGDRSLSDATASSKSSPGRPDEGTRHIFAGTVKRSPRSRHYSTAKVAAPSKTSVRGIFAAAE